MVTWHINNVSGLQALVRNKIVVHLDRKRCHTILHCQARKRVLSTACMAPCKIEQACRLHNADNLVSMDIISCNTLCSRQCRRQPVCATDVPLLCASASGHTCMQQRAL